MDITDAQWAFLEPLFRPKRRADGRGRPWQDTRAALNGVFWVLRTGAPWHDLPRRYPPYQTCHRRLQHWQRSGLLTRLLQKLAEDLRDRGKLDLSESFIDASFSSAKKGALVSALQNAAKAAKSWQSQTAWSSSRRARGQRFAS
jgi:transposase